MVSIDSTSFSQSTTADGFHSFGSLASFLPRAAGEADASSTGTEVRPRFFFCSTVDGVPIAPFLLVPPALGRPPIDAKYSLTTSCAPLSSR